jgi:hypothetical protein
VLGQARARTYGLPKSIHGLPAQQSLYLLDEAGQPSLIGQVTLLAGDVLHLNVQGSTNVERHDCPGCSARCAHKAFSGACWHSA